MSLGAWLFLFILDNLLNLPAAIRFPLAVGGGVLLLVGFVRRVVIPALRDVSAERTAVMLERSRNMNDNLLINACQLQAQELDSGESLFASRTVKRSSNFLESIPVRSFWNGRILVKWGVATGLIVAVWIAYGLVFPRQTFNALVRYAAPLGDVPPAGSVALEVNPSSDLTVDEDGDLPVAATVEGHGNVAAQESAPVIVWAEGNKAVAPARNVGDTAVMLESATPGHYSYVFRSIQRSFSFRVLAADAYSRSVHIAVLPKPRITSSVVRIKPPSYTGLAAHEVAGPPASVSCLPMSEIEVQMEFDRSLAAVDWNFAKSSRPFKRSRNVWTAHTIITNAGPYTLETKNAKNSQPASAASGEVELETDRPPEVEFVTDNRNLFVAAGTELSLTVRASDDFGMSNVVVTCRPGDDLAGTNAIRTLKQWIYSGPPGNPGPVRESLTIVVAPSSFVPGETYLIEAASWDFKPGGKPGRSRPIVLRVKSLDDLTLPSGDVLANAMNLLRKTIADQKKANEITDNLRTHLDEAIQNKRVDAHRDSMKKQQEEARSTGRQTIREFLKFPSDGRLYADRLSVLAENEMGLALAQISEIEAKTEKELTTLLGKAADRQEYILNELIALLGEMADERKSKDKIADGKNNRDTITTPALRDESASLADELGEFERAQKRIIENSRTLLDKLPADLTKDEKEEIIGALAREEAEWAKFLEEKLTDFAKLPLQDFGDGSAARQLNEVVQDVDKAAESLYQKKVELAVPMEQSGLEKAEELVNNLEKWLPNKPDNTKWSVEEPAAQIDIPMSELPAELEDIVGELLDKEDNMQQDVEDVSSSWLDSIDKGAGWDAVDGPISSMSAKGITGNQLPNQQEIGGRSGEGRSGRSNGQMVQDTAEGKDGRTTPTRVSPSPFEPGSVKDSSKTDNGGATGGGRLSGFSEPGLRGPTPPPSPEKMARIAGSQTRIRQEAEVLDLRLRKYKLPSGDVETSIAAMKSVQEAVKSQDGVAVRRSYNGAIDALEAARKEIRAEIGLHRERSRLPESELREIMTGLQDGTPKGYEELVADYFRRMAGDTR
jgi:hypothetical protein